MANEAPKHREARDILLDKIADMADKTTAPGTLKTLAECYALVMGKSQSRSE